MMQYHGKPSGDNRNTRAAGITNGLGGMTNGLGGRTNGMTNGLGGKTNGLTNGLGRTNGMTNGLGGKTNGLTNGLGGMTNGLESGPSQRRGRLDDRAISPSKISLVLIIAFIILLPTLFFLLAHHEPTETGLRVDGEFDDWDGSTVFADGNPYSVDRLDIIEYAVESNDMGNLFIYARAKANWFSGSDADSLFVFIDNDNDPNKGYKVRNLGAEYAVEIYGWDNQIKGRQFGVFNGQDQHNWTAWDWSSAPAAISGDRMEIRITGASISPDASILLMTKTGSEVADVCDAAVSRGRGALVVRQTPLTNSNGTLASDSIMELKLAAVGSDVTVTDIQFSSNAGTPSAAVPSAPIPAGQSVTVQVTLPISGLASGTFVSVSVSGVACDGRATILDSGLAAYAHDAPDGIAIDGAFGDWEKNVPVKRDDPRDALPNPDIDIRQHAAVNSTSQAYFYLKTDDAGTLFGGGAVPGRRAKPVTPAEPTEPTEPRPPVPLRRVSGEDVTRIYIETKPTGGQSIGGINADYFIEIRGRNGLITSSALYSLPGRAPVSSANVEAANWDRELELGVPLNRIGYADYIEYFIESTDWAGNSDATTTAGLAQITGGTRAGGNFGGGDGSAGNPWLVEDVLDLQAIGSSTTYPLSAHYALANDIDATATSTWNDDGSGGYYGFDPIGDSSNAFTGSFDGRDFTISGLYINRPSTWYVGLFAWVGSTGSVKNAIMTGADVTGYGCVGTLAGENDGTAENCQASGEVSGGSYIGGLIGYELGTISDCHVSGSTVTGTGPYVGGLVGFNEGPLSLSSSVADVTGDSYVGGLLGTNDDTVTYCHAAGTAIATRTEGGYAYVGGFVGQNTGSGSISKSYTIATATGSVQVGGFVGYNQGGTVDNSYSRGSATRTSGSTYTEIGGFVGDNYRGSITNCYSTGQVIYVDATNPMDKGFAGSVDTGGSYHMSGNFWDNQTSGQLSTVGEATGRNTADMKTESTFTDAGWDFLDETANGVEDIWAITSGINDGYPVHAPEYHHILLPILAMLGIIFLTRRKEEPEGDDDEEPAEADSEAEDSGDAPVIKKTMLLIGLALGILGLGGIAGLRSGIIQGILGHSASPGIGSQEAMGLMVSAAPLAIGLVMIGMWGIKNDPIYHQIEKARSGDAAEEEEEEPSVPEEEPGKAILEEGASEELMPESIPEESKEPVAEETAEPEPMDLDGSIADQEKELGDISGAEVAPKPEPQPKAAPPKPAAKRPAAKPEVRPELKKGLEELDDFDRELAEAEEQKRVQRCNKMLSAAILLPDDKERLKALIPTGISVKDFTGEVKKAVQWRKKKEAEKDVTAEEKASLVEDELIAELGQLGEEINDNSKLEEQILKELEDLDDL